MPLQLPRLAAPPGVTPASRVRPSAQLPLPLTSLASAGRIPVTAHPTRAPRILSPAMALGRSVTIEPPCHPKRGSRDPGVHDGHSAATSSLLHPAANCRTLLGFRRRGAKGLQTLLGARQGPDTVLLRPEHHPPSPSSYGSSRSVSSKVRRQVRLSAGERPEAKP